jgi:protein-disulfide isomerase
MSQPTTTGPAGPKGPAGRSAGAQARAARAAAARAERERKARAAKMRNLAISIAVVVVLAIAAVIVIPRLHSSSSSTAATPAGLTTYTGIKGTTVKGSVEGPATAPVTIVLFEDFQCPYCEQLETNAGAEFTSLASQGKIRIVYDMVSFLDVNSKNQYSSRAANAFYCAPQAQRHDLHEYFYAHQPKEQTAGPTDSQLIADAKRFGATSSGYASCVDAHTYSSFATGPQTAALASAAGSVGTPTMTVNGQVYPGVQSLTPTILDQVVAQASLS